MKIIGVIPARYKSSRFPGKPLADICGKPMIQRTYEQALKAPELDELYVATDDKRIYDIVKNFGGKAVMTSEECATGTDRVAEIAEKIPADVYVNIQGDEPVIDPGVIKQVVDAILECTDEFSVVTLKKRMTDPDEIASRDSVKVVTDKNDCAMYFSRAVIPSQKRGFAGEYFRHAGVYAYRRPILLEYRETPPNELEMCEATELLRIMYTGHKIKVLETTYTSVAVDSPEDLKNIIRILSNDN